MRPPSVHLLLPREEVIGDLAAQGVYLFFYSSGARIDFDESLKMLSESRARCIKVADTYARIEEDLNEGLRVARNHFRDTATATLALTCGKNDRGHNEVLYLHESLAMVDSLCSPGIRTTTASRWS